MELITPGSKQIRQHIQDITIICKIITNKESDLIIQKQTIPNLKLELPLYPAGNNTMNCEFLFFFDRRINSLRQLAENYKDFWWIRNPP